MQSCRGVLRRRSPATTAACASASARVPSPSRRGAQSSRGVCDEESCFRLATVRFRKTRNLGLACPASLGPGLALTSIATTCVSKEAARERERKEKRKQAVKPPGLLENEASGSGHRVLRLRTARECIRSEEGCQRSGRGQKTTASADSPGRRLTL